jgi:hypothetical protein
VSNENEYQELGHSERHGQQVIERTWVDEVVAYLHYDALGSFSQTIEVTNLIRQT